MESKLRDEADRREAQSLRYHHFSGSRVCERLPPFNCIALRVDTQKFKDFGICDLRFGLGLVGINHVMGDAESLGKFVN